MQVQLTGGDYQARGLIAAAQRCVNLYAEAVPQQQGEPNQFVYLPTPGLVALTAPLNFLTTGDPVRGIYQASTGEVIAVIGGIVYWCQLGAAAAITLVEIGTIPVLTTPVAMSDNGIVLVIVDGVVGHGWFITLKRPTLTVTHIYDDSFYGSTTVAYLDTFFVFNRPDTQDFYVSPSNWDGNAQGLTGDPFDGTYIAAKTTSPDLLKAVAVAGQVLWLIGETTAEPWYDAGAADFPFQRVSGFLINHGTKAPYSVAVGSVPDGAAAVFWLGNDAAGRSIVFQTEGFQAGRISTHALEAAFASYSVVSDARAYCYQEEGHFFYVLSFPSADATWCFDVATGFWHERTFTNADGSQHMHRVATVVNTLGLILAGDYTNGALYNMTKDALTDGGQPITRLRTFPHLINDGNRARYSRFIANMSVGQSAGAELDLQLSWSDDRGVTFGSPVKISLGSSGQTTVVPTVWRLGIARDRVFSLTWSGAAFTSLLGAFIDVEPMAS